MSTPIPSPIRRRTFRMAVTAAAIALVALLATPTAASAHDQLISSDPAADSQLAAAPTTVTLEFSAAIMTTGLAMTVVDADGADHLVGEPIADGTTVTAEIDTLPVGGYQVRWRVVSSDGHPISGYIPFTVGDADPLPAPTIGEENAAETPAATTDTEAGTDTEHTRGEVTTSTNDTAAAGTSAAAPDDSGVLRTVLIGAAGAVVAVGVLVLIVVLNRRSHRNDTTDTSDSSL